MTGGTAGLPEGFGAARVHACVEALCQLPGPTGHEGRVRAYVERSWAERGLEPVADAVGNLLARVGGSGPRVLIQAHMDEVGFLVRHVTAEGFLFLDSAQGGRRDLPERRFMVGQRAAVLGRGDVVARGVFAAPSGHVMTPSQLEKPMTLSDLFVDVGAESREQVEAAGVHVGSPVVWDSPTRLHGNRIVSKALDDRMLLAAIELLLDRLDREQLTCELWVAATVQEENGCHGARALAVRERFDAVLALDVALAGDVPVMDPTAVEGRLGDGPVVVHHDAFIAYAQELVWAVIDAGRAAGVPIQHGVFSSYGTDGMAFIDNGSPAVAIGPPTRYTHTANETADVRDLAQTVVLLEAFATARR
jgi:tetrahedral aminopeptidase